MNGFNVTFENDEPVGPLGQVRVKPADSIAKITGGNRGAHGASR